MTLKKKAGPSSQARPGRKSETPTESYAQRSRVAIELLGRSPTPEECDAILRYSDTDISRLRVLRNQQRQMQAAT